MASMPAGRARSQHDRSRARSRARRRRATELRRGLEELKPGQTARSRRSCERQPCPRARPPVKCLASRYRCTHRRRCPLRRRSSPIGETRPRPPNSSPARARSTASSQRSTARRRWGQPARLDRADLPRTTETARRLIAVCRAQQLPSGIPWPEWLARELCGRGPLDDLLDDVNGHDPHRPRCHCDPRPPRRGPRARGDPILVRRGCSRSRRAMDRPAPRRARACLEICPCRGYLGARPRSRHRARRPGRACHPYEPSAAHRGSPSSSPSACSRKPRPTCSPNASGAAAASLSTATPQPTYRPLTRALVGACPAERSIAVVRRVRQLGRRSSCSSSPASAQGPSRRPGASTRTGSSIEEVEATDAADLCAAACGTPAAARSPRSAPALPTPPSPASPPCSLRRAAGRPAGRACRRHHRPRCLRRHPSRPAAASVVHTIAEARPGARGELAELFTWNADIAAVHPTDVEIHLLR
jgi:hypothetical protein